MKELSESKATFVFGQMNEPPVPCTCGLKWVDYCRILSGWRRKGKGRDILFFVDNIFRFTQAGSEVSALLGRMPSAVGYQPTLATEMGIMQERITSTKNGSITSVQAVYVPADDLTDRLRQPRLLTLMQQQYCREKSLTLVFTRRWIHWILPQGY